MITVTRHVYPARPAAMSTGDQPVRTAALRAESERLALLANAGQATAAQRRRLEALRAAGVKGALL